LEKARVLGHWPELRKAPKLSNGSRSMREPLVLSLTRKQGHRHEHWYSAFGITNPSLFMSRAAVDCVVAKCYPTLTRTEYISGLSTGSHRLMNKPDSKHRKGYETDRHHLHSGKILSISGCIAISLARTEASFPMSELSVKNSNEILHLVYNSQLILQTERSEKFYL
jgi:hypothetical protein